MTNSEIPCRRVGTFTFGVILVVSGAAMLTAIYWPEFNLQWLLQLSPLLLISLGVETLIAARDNRRIKYDWVGMLLCCLIVGAALCLFAVSWILLHYPDFINL
ncbi:MAG: hypothetical protein IJ396_03795 [Oscillibacter sp.]|nr:hypothetical protein [Oscillibacter sp.]